MASSPPPADSPPSPTPPSPSPPPTSSSSPPPTPTPPSSSSSPPPTPESSSPPPSSPPPATSSPPPTTSPPPPATSLAPPKTPPTTPPTSASPPPKASLPPPSPLNSNSSPPPPPQENTSPPTPSNNNSGPPTPTTTPPPPQPTTPGSSNSIPPPPPPHSSSSSPPPPSSKSLSPPHAPTHHSPPPPPPPSTDNSLSQTMPLLIGLVAGIGLFLIVMIVIYLACAKKKKKTSPDQMQYYSNPPQGAKGSEIYNGSQHRSWHNNSQIPPPPGAMGSPHGGWVAPHSTQPPMMSSDEASSNFSGPVLPPPPPVLGFNKSTFTYDELAAATGGFAQDNLLGQGGFGYVHKGVLPNGKEIAVKSLKSGSGQGEREFQAEVEIISRVHHRHLVSLVGYCIAGGQRMLVYEFVPNKTLEYHLHGKGRPTMDWPTRLKIALGSAKGLAYLHEDCHPRIIHRDIKTANILLDYNFEAMVADFGLAKLSSDNYTHVSTRIMGTFGYLAPEYASSGKLTEKSDVFSYGVMLLELITGRRPVDNTNQYEDMDDSLADWAKPILLRTMEDGNLEGLVDPHLENNYNPQEMTRMAACAAACIRRSGRRRPKMSQMVRALEGDVSLEDLNEGVKPGQSSMFGSTGSSSEYDAGTYGADMKKFRRMALASQDYGSSEYGATSEYGLNPSSSSGDSLEMGDKGSQRHIP